MAGRLTTASNGLSVFSKMFAKELYPAPASYVVTVEDARIFVPPIVKKLAKD